MRISNISSVIFSIFCLQVYAQSGEAIELGEKAFIESAVLGETREIWIATPYGYERSNENFPVLIVLDGASHFRHASTSAEHLARSNRIPGIIVVAVLSTQRGRDFTPPSDDPEDAIDVPAHGGADQFLEFLTTELLPYIDRNYQASTHRMLSGHSLGGLFAMHTLINKPESFNGYIIMSPSLDWSNQALVQRAAEVFPDLQELEVDLFISVGNEGGETLGAVRKITGILGEDTPRGLRWKFHHMPEEHHNSMTLRSVYYGLESLFAGWSIPDYLEVYEIGGLAGLESTYAKGGVRFGYERELPITTKLQLADDLISFNRLDEADAIILNELGTVPPSYFLNLLAEKYDEDGNNRRAIELNTLALTLNPTDEIARQRLADKGIDTGALINVFEIDEDVLKTYTGVYQPIPEFQMTVYVEGARLFSQGTGQAATELVPVSETRFNITGADTQVEFFKDAKGEASHLILYQFGQEIEAPRIE